MISKQIYDRNLKNFIENGGYKMYKYDMPNSIGEVAKNLFESIQEETEKKDSLAETKVLLSQKLGELDMQRQKAVQKIDLQQIKSLDGLISTVKDKLKETEEQIAIREREKIEAEQDETQLLEELKKDKTHTIKGEDYEHKKLFETAYSFLKKLDLNTAQEVLESNSQLKQALGDDSIYLIERLQENVGKNS